MKREHLERASDFLFLLQAAMLAVGSWKPELSPFADLLPRGGTQLYWMQVLMLITAVTMVITTIQSRRHRALMQRILAGRPNPSDLEIISSRPPEFARYLLWFLPKKTREPLLGDLEEDFHNMVEEFGQRRAQFRYWSQVLFAFCPPIYWLFKRLVGGGFLSWFVNVIRQFFS